MEGTGYALGYMPRPDISITDILEAAIKLKTEKKEESDTNTEIRYALNKVCFLPYSDIPKVYDELSAGKWPEQLGQKPKEWDETDWLKRSEVVKPTLERIKKTCGAKMLERYRYTARLGMTDSQFEDWWECVGKKENSDKWSLDPIWLMLIMTLLSKGF